VVSFDGQRVLFAGKSRREDPWQVWETALEGRTAGFSAKPCPGGRRGTPRWRQRG